MSQLGHIHFIPNAPNHTRNMGPLDLLEGLTGMLVGRTLVAQSDEPGDNYVGLFYDIDLLKLVSAIQHVTELEEINPLSGHINLLKHDPT